MAVDLTRFANKLFIYIARFIILCSHYILIQPGLTGSRTFLMSNRNSYFSHYNPKISALNLSYFGSYSRKCASTSIMSIRYTYVHFLMYFHSILIPSVTFSYFCPRRENKELP